MQTLATILFVLAALLLDTIEEGERARKQEARKIVSNIQATLEGMKV